MKLDMTDMLYALSFSLAQAEYEKRISRFAKLKVTELADEAAPKSPSEKDIQAL